MTSQPPLALPAGVRLVLLHMHADDRGVFTELFRQSWFDELTPLQWNVVRSEPDVLRGVHVHLRHADYVTVVSGRALFGLCDLRPGSPTVNLRTLVEMDGRRLQALFIPPGVAHGFYFLEHSMHIYAVSEYWDMEDELGCHFADPDLALSWPTTTPRLSPRDQALPSLAALKGLIPAWRDAAPTPQQASRPGAGSAAAM
jgi:dTDP-4-dehydrorhamnose 3,5-epimerase